MPTTQSCSHFISKCSAGPGNEGREANEKEKERKRQGRKSKTATKPSTQLQCNSGFGDFNNDKK